MCQIGVSTLVFSMLGITGEKGVNNLVDMASKLDVSLQLVMHRGWSKPVLKALADGAQVIATERLFIEQRILFRYFDPPEVAEKVYNKGRGLFSDSIEVAYVPRADVYIHAVPAMCDGDWDALIALYNEGKVAGFVMDTCHTLAPSGKYLPLAGSPDDFCRKCDLLLNREIPLLFHLQPSRIPRSGSFFVVSNVFEVFSFIAGYRNARLSTLLSSLRGVEHVPVIIELDPKMGFFLQRPGMLWLLQKMKSAIVREVKSIPY